MHEKHGNRQPNQITPHHDHRIRSIVLDPGSIEDLNASRGRAGGVKARGTDAIDILPINCFRSHVCSGGTEVHRFNISYHILTEI